VLALMMGGTACTDDGEDGPEDGVRPSVSTASTTPQAGREGDDPAESRDNVDVDRDDSGAGSPSDENSDEGSNSGAGDTNGDGGTG
jgi:hypothetical protein